jgi:O-antigen/teichoic acid export membrane protein
MHLYSLGLVLAIGVFTVVCTALLASIAVVFIGGSEYSDLQGQLWGFALLGTLLAMIQLMIYDVVARQHQRMVFVVWAALATLLCVAPFVDSLRTLLTTVLCVDAALFAVLLLASLRDARTPQPTAQREDAPHHA